MEKFEDQIISCGIWDIFPPFKSIEWLFSLFLRLIASAALQTKESNILLLFSLVLGGENPLHFQKSGDMSPCPPPVQAYGIFWTVVIRKFEDFIISISLTWDKVYQHTKNTIMMLVNAGSLRDSSLVNASVNTSWCRHFVFDGNIWTHTLMLVMLEIKKWL